MINRLNKMSINITKPQMKNKSKFNKIKNSNKKSVILIKKKSLYNTLLMKCNKQLAKCNISI